MAGIELYGPGLGFLDGRYQPLDATLTSIALLGTGADKMIYTTAIDTWAEQAATSYGRSLLTPANSLAAQILLDLTIGGTVEAHDATLTALAGANWAANSLAIGSGADTVSQVTFAANTFPARSSSGNLVAKTITDFALTLLDDADAATARTTLGLVSGGAGDIWLKLVGGTMTGQLVVDINSDTSAIKIVQNATQTTFPIQLRNSADSAYTSAIDANGRFRSVASTTSGIAWMDNTLASTTYLTINHTSTTGTLTNGAGDLQINGFATASTVFNSGGVDINHIFRTVDDDNALNIDGGLNTLAIGDTPASVKKLTISQSSASTGNPTTLIVNGTQTASAATTLKGAVIQLFFTHTSGSLSGGNVSEFNWTASGNGGTTSTVEGLNFIGNVSAGATVTTANYIHLYAPNNSGTLTTLNALKIDAGHVIFNDGQGDYDFRAEGDSLEYMLFLDATATTENIALVTTAAPNWQTMDRGLFLGDTSNAPNANPSAGIFIWSESGAGKARGGSGTVTTWAPAEPHCPVCGADFMLEWENEEKYGHLAVCMRCLANELGDRPYITNHLKN